MTKLTPNPWNPWPGWSAIPRSVRAPGRPFACSTAGGLIIGRGCDLAAGVQVYTHSTAARCVTDRAVDTERAPVVIGDHTFIGANSVALMGVTIGSRCVIGAGSVVTRDVPDGMCASGVPARLGRVVEPGDGRITSPS